MIVPNQNHILNTNPVNRSSIDECIIYIYIHGRMHYTITHTDKNMYQHNAFSIFQWAKIP